jgi:3-hydroxyisobutyrate dehydrogenase-like beta-hydroxyacid dehydrogenase
MAIAEDGLRVGVIGLGTIGGGIAVSLARRGRFPAVYDVRREVVLGLSAVADPLGSAAEVAARSDVVFISVVDADQVRSVVLAPNGVVKEPHKDLVILVTATIPVRVVRDLAGSCASRGISVLDCGVNLGSRAAENGLLLLVGGPDEAIRRVRPVLDDIAAQVIPCGPLGTGMATKLGCQVVTAGRWRAVHEAVELVTAAGVDPATLVAAVEASDPDGTSLMRLQRLRMADASLDEFSRPVAHYPRNLDKDLAAAQELAAATGVDVPMVDLVRAKAADTFAWVGQVDQLQAPELRKPRL